MFSNGFKLLRRVGTNVSQNRLDHFSAVGVIKKAPKDGKSYKSGDHLIHSELSYRGVILYSWPGKRILGNGEKIKEKFYQVLVDQRDADDLPMELEILRISDVDRESSDFTPTRFKNWDLVPHSEICRYKPLDAGLAIKHHLMHHFLKSFYSYKEGVPTWEVRRTPTLNYWRKKFSAKPVVCHEAEVEFISISEGENKSDDKSDKVTAYVIPYHLTTNTDSNINFIGHLTRFTCNSEQHYEITERVALAENPVTGELREQSMKTSIHLGGNYNSIYQHVRHVEIPHGDSNLVFVYKVQRMADGKEMEIVIPAFSVSSSPSDPQSEI